jgi:hypothetical protein
MRLLPWLATSNATAAGQTNAASGDFATSCLLLLVVANDARVGELRLMQVQQARK